MTDIFTKEKRSQIMAAIPGKETNPEIAVRRFLFSKGFRFRKNVKTLPGKPDIVLSKYKTIILIHGCFWHGHSNCKKAKMPNTNKEFWTRKIQINIDRDEKTKILLNELGWNVIIIWECNLRNKRVMEESMTELLTLLNFQMEIVDKNK